MKAIKTFDSLMMLVLRFDMEKLGKLRFQKTFSEFFYRSFRSIFRNVMIAIGLICFKYLSVMERSLIHLVPIQWMVDTFFSTIGLLVKCHRGLRQFWIRFHTSTKSKLCKSVCFKDSKNHCMKSSQLGHGRAVLASTANFGWFAKIGQNWLC